MIIGGVIDDFIEKLVKKSGCSNPISEIKVHPDFYEAIAGDIRCNFRHKVDYSYPQHIVYNGVGGSFTIKQDIEPLIERKKEQIEDLMEEIQRLEAIK